MCAEVLSRYGPLPKWEGAYLSCWRHPEMIVRDNECYVNGNFVGVLACMKYPVDVNFIYYLTGYMVGVKCSDINVSSDLKITWIKYEDSLLRAIIHNHFVATPPSMTVNMVCSYATQSLFLSQLLVPNYRFWYGYDLDFMSARDLFRIIDDRGNGRKGWCSSNFNVFIYLDVYHQRTNMVYHVLNMNGVTEDDLNSDPLVRTLERYRQYDKHILWAVKNFRREFGCSVYIRWLGGTRDWMEVSLKFRWNLTSDLGSAEPSLKAYYLCDVIPKEKVYLVQDVGKVLYEAWPNEFMKCIDCHKPNRFIDRMYNLIPFTDCVTAVGQPPDLNRFISHDDMVVVHDRRIPQLDWLIEWIDADQRVLFDAHKYKDRTPNERKDM